MKAYVLGKSDRPLVVHGHSGCGKTSVMTSVAVKVMFNNILFLLINTSRLFLSESTSPL